MTKLTIFLAAVMTFFAPGHAETLGGGTARSQRQSLRAQAEQSLMRDFMSALQESQRTGVAPEGMGFLPTDSQLIPPAVRQAARSTFRIAIPGGDLISATTVFKNTPLPEVLRELQTRPLNSDFEAADRAIYTYQVSECIRLKVKDCMIFAGVSFGSGFVTGDGRELRTALHVVRDYVAQERKGKVSSQIPLFILDSQDKVIFGPHNLRITVGALPEGALATSVYEGGRDSGRFNLDQIVFKLSSPIARPIPIARSLLRDGEAAFIIGVGKKTEEEPCFMRSMLTESLCTSAAD